MSKKFNKSLNLNYLSSNATFGSLAANSFTGGNVSLAGILATVNITSTNISSASINATAITASTLALSTGITSANAQITNAAITTLTAATLLNTNAVATNVSSATLNLSGGITSANANITTETVGTSRITGNLLALGNSNTLGSIITTGGNVGINTTSPVHSLDVNGGIRVTNITSTNILTTNISSSTLALSGGITSATAQITNVVSTNISSVTAQITNAVVTNISSTNVFGNTISTGTLMATIITGGNLSLSGNLVLGGTLTTVNITSTNVVDTNMSVGTLTCTNVSTSFLTIGNAVSTNISSATLALSGGITSASAQIANVNATNISTGVLIASTGISSASVRINSGANGFGLYLQGSVADGPVLKLENTAVGGLTYAVGSTSTASGGGRGFSIYDQTNSASRLLIGSTGNVGIGTITPLYTLDVNGGIRATNITSTNVLTTNISSSTLVLSTGITTSSINVSGTSSFTNTVATNISTGNINAQSITVSNGNLTVTAGTLYASDLNMTGAVTMNTNMIKLGGAGGLSSLQLDTGNIDGPTLNGNLGGRLSVGGSDYLRWESGIVKVPVAFSAGNVTATNISSSTLILTTGITTSNAQITSETVGTSRITVSLLALGNSNTVGSIFTTGGNVGVNTVTPSAPLHVGGTMTTAPTGNGVLMGTSTDNYAVLQMNSTTGSCIDFSTSGVDYKGKILYNNANNYMELSTNGLAVARFTNIGDFVSTGDVTAFGSLSDFRLKKNIQDITVDIAVDTVKLLRPVTFDWREDIFNQSKRNTPDVGFIAQEVELLIPLAVSEYPEMVSGETYKNIKHERLIPYLVGALQNALRRIEDLEKCKLSI